MKIATGLLLCALCTLTAGGAMAAEIRVLSAGAVEPGLRAAAAAFKKQSGHDVRITFNTAPEIRKRIAGGDSFDVVIAPPAALDEFAGAGKLTAERVALGRVGQGVAVRAAAARGAELHFVFRGADDDRRQCRACQGPRALSRQPREQGAIREGRHRLVSHRSMRVVAALLSCAVAGAAWATDIRVLSAGAVEPGLAKVADQFRRETNNRVRTVFFAGVPQLERRLSVGEPADVLV